ncbi:unnamed protein product [Chilo suppressalis]|uniref:Large ribosomal subunit protein mL38 n=1 Tax=Chilo suppressalis TaxID=168631 RepID=A0ABN8BAS0_CHISP|nr:hypothetical protein evm_010057 [Chilo suppressalis]CAH0406959.1 unnamed protein product [Chilo suppressalis]
MLNTFRGTLVTSVQCQQIRLGHRIRGKAPIYCRTIKERLDELNYKDEICRTKIDIGLPIHPTSSSKLRNERLEHVKKVKSDKTVEKLARDHKLQVDMGAVRKEWLKTLGPYHKKNIADHYGIFEHLYGEGYFIPIVNMDICYDINDELSLPVYTGNVIKPQEALQRPSIIFESDKDALWTLVMTSLDGHLTASDNEYVHWFMANIPGDHVEKGDTLVEYLQPFPLKGTGFHRYVFVLYKQNGKVSYDIPKVTSAALENRTFVTRDWYKKNQDAITPVGLAFFQSDWDETVREFFHKTLNTKEPIYEYDFPAPYIRPQEFYPRRKPFNLYMDKYRDPKQINKEYLIRKLKNEDPFKKPAPPLKFPNAHAFPKGMPSWLKLHERKIRLGWGRVNDV